ncbi:MAG: hypothetical protein AAFR38_10590 [Planctomycetota bacterium]
MSASETRWMRPAHLLSLIVLVTVGLGGCATHAPIDQIRVLSDLHETGRVRIGSWASLEAPAGEIDLGDSRPSRVYWDRRGFDGGTLISFEEPGTGARTDSGLVAVGNLAKGDDEYALFLASYSTRKPGTAWGHGYGKQRTHVRALAARIDPETDALRWSVGDLSEFSEHLLFKLDGDMVWAPPSQDWDDTLRCFRTSTFFGSVTINETRSGASWSVPLP